MFALRNEEPIGSEDGRDKVMDIFSKSFDVFGDDFADLMDEIMKEAAEEIKDFESKEKQETNEWHGFSYPPVKDDKKLYEQLDKIYEELDEAKEAIASWAANELVEMVTIGDDEISRALHLGNALVELEDVIHAAEEMQRKMLAVSGYNEESFDDLKKTVMKSVYMKNMGRGYYGER